MALRELHLRHGHLARHLPKSTPRRFRTRRVRKEFCSDNRGTGRSSRVPQAWIRFQTHREFTPTEAFEEVMKNAASGRLRIETETVALAEIEAAWERNGQGRRLVVIP